MIHSREVYLKELAKELKQLPNREELLLEIDSHLIEMLYELKESEDLNEEMAMPRVVERLGKPQEIASTFKQEAGMTSTRVKWIFILMNVLFFFGGICLTVVYNLLSTTIVVELWKSLTSITTLLILLYMMFWALLGYEIGKEFGMGGKSLLKRTFHYALIPNLVLMVLVVFKVVPLSWFDPLLTPPFIIICILGTILLYPISYTAFRWGTMRSI